MGLLIERYGIAILGQRPDVQIIIQSGRALDIYRTFQKAGELGGPQRMTEAEWKLIQEIMMGDDS